MKLSLAKLIAGTVGFMVASTAFASLGWYYAPPLAAASDIPFWVGAGSDDPGYLMTVTLYKNGVMIDSATESDSVLLVLQTSISVESTISAALTGEAGEDEISGLVRIDSQVPSAPSNLSGTNRTATAFTLGWTGSTDDTGIDHYEVWDKHSQSIYSTGLATTKNFSGLQDGVPYEFDVRAIDYAGRASNWIVFTITLYPPGVVFISAQGGSSSLPYQLPGSTVTLTANAPSTGQQFQSWIIVSGSGSFADATAAITTFTIGSADTVVQTTYVTDVTPPMPPGGLTVSDVFADAVSLMWAPSVDRGIVTQYEIFRDGVSVGTVSGTTAFIDGLSAATTYRFTVRAKDSANNWSTQCGAITAKTWQRIYSSSGTIYESEGEMSTDWHDFSLQSAATAKVYFRSGSATFTESNNSSSQEGGVLTYRNTDSLKYFNVTSATATDYTVYVDFIPLVADFAVNPAAARGPLYVALDASASVDPFGAITSYAWDFDNSGTTDAYGRTAYPYYYTSGPTVATYTIKLTVTGASGSINTTRNFSVYRSDASALTVQNGTTSMPFQIQGWTATLTAAVPAGATFTGWTIISGAGSFANASASTTTFTMGSGGDTIVAASYSGGGDTMAPSAPSGLNYADRTASTVTLVWRAASDNIGVVGYRVYRGTTDLGTTSDLAFTDGGLSANTTYTYTVKAFDAAGNYSSASSSLNVTTTQDFSADGDHDGVPDAAESALGTNASSAGVSDSGNATQLRIQRPPK